MKVVGTVVLVVSFVVAIFLILTGGFIFVSHLFLKNPPWIGALYMGMLILYVVLLRWYWGRSHRKWQTNK